MGRLLKTRGNTERPHSVVRHKGLSCPLSKERAVVVVLLFLLLLFMIIIIIVIFSASIAKEEVRSCYGKWNFGPGPSTLSRGNPGSLTEISEEMDIFNGIHKKSN